MLPRHHFILSLLPTVLIGYFNYLDGILFIIGAFLIDFDHYVVYALAFNDLSLKKAIRFFEVNVFYFLKNERAKVFLPFHNIESLLALFIISTYIPLLYFLFFGVAYHYILDLSFDYLKFRRFVREFSIIQYILRPNRLSITEIKSDKIQK